MLHQATVTLTDAQIKSLPTTSVRLACAPGADRLNIPLYGILQTFFVAGYDVGVDQYLFIGNDASPEDQAPRLAYIANDSTGTPPHSYLSELFSKTDGDIEMMAAHSFSSGFGWGSIGEAVIGGSFTPVGYNKETHIKILPATDLSGGHADNLLSASMVYLIFNAKTRLYE